MKALETYLSATRIGANDGVGAGARLMYEGVVAQLRDIVRPFSPPECRVAIVFTLNRRTEITRIQGEPVLIYDRYLGQLLNTLTRILQWGDDTRAGERAFGRIFAEMALLAGDAPGSVAGYVYSSARNEFWNLPPAGGDFQVSASVRLQELFVFAHEYCHLLMNASSEFQASRRRIGQLLLEPEDEDNAPELYAQFAERYPNYQTFDQWTRTRREWRLFIDEHSDAIRDELACDDFAMSAVLISARDLQIGVVSAFEAIFLALRNVRVLSYIRVAATPRLARRGLAGATHTRMLQARQHLLRRAFRYAAVAHELADDEVTAVWPRLMDLSDEHDRRVDDPLLFKCLPTLKKARLGAAKMRPRLGMIEAFEIAKAHGWQPQAREVDYIIL